MDSSRSSLPQESSPSRSISPISDCIVVRDNSVARTTLNTETNITSIMSQESTPSIGVKEDSPLFPTGDSDSTSEITVPDTESLKALMPPPPLMMAPSLMLPPSLPSTPQTTRQLRPRSFRAQSLQPSTTPKRSLRASSVATTTDIIPPAVEPLMDTINVKDTPDDIQKKLHPYDFSELRRRSARISLLDEVKQIAPENVTLTPKQETGKRSHDAMIAGSRSANAKLQSSKSKIWDVPLDEAQHGPQTKKPKKVINKELIEKKKKSISPPIESEGEESEVEEKKEELKYAPGSRVRTKKWLTEGIYAGTDPEAAARRGRKGRTSTSKKRKPILPLPIYKGLEILNTQRDMKLPFHIYSASPYKLHPEGWKKRNRNVFIGDAADLWKKEKSNPSGKCVCTSESGCDEDCLNRCVYYECDEENCAIGPELCQNRPFKALKDRAQMKSKFSEGVEVMETTDRGYGLRATRSYEPNQIIVEYCGEIISQEETERRVKTIYKKNKSYYLMLFDQNMIIDATTGSIARFINHSCEPNCRMEKWIVGNQPRMALFAGDRGVETGEELTYDYNFNWFSGVSTQECRCGSQNCRGALGKRTNQTSAPSPVEKEKPVRGAKAKVTKKPANRLRGKIVVGGEKPKIVAKKVQPRKVIGLRKGPLAKKAVASTKKTTTKVAAKAAAKVAAKVTAKVAVKVTTKKALAVPKKVLPARKTLALRKATAPAPKKAPVVEKVTAVKKTVSKKVPVSAKKAIAARKAAEAEKILAERVASVPVTIPEKPQPKQKTTRTFKIVKKKVVKRTINQTIFRQTVTISTESTRTTVLKPPTKTTFVRPLTAVEFEAGTFRKPHKKRVPKVTTVDTATAGTPAPEETTPLIKPERPSDEELIQNDAAQDSIIGPLPEKVLAPVVLDTIVVVG